MSGQKARVRGKAVLEKGRLAKLQASNGGIHARALRKKQWWSTGFLQERSKCIRDDNSKPKSWK